MPEPMALEMRDRRTHACPELGEKEDTLQLRRESYAQPFGLRPIQSTAWVGKHLKLAASREA